MAINLFQGSSRLCGYQKRVSHFPSTRVAAILLAAAVASSVARAQTQTAFDQAKLQLPAGVEKLCAIQFDQDGTRPARVEDGALQCLREAADALKKRPDRKLVLVGVSDPMKDHEEKDNGTERESEDMTGLDVRYEDIAAYRAVNTKAYLTRFYKIDPSRILPTTNENRKGQDVRFYLVPADADFLHNYLNTTRTNEKPCTVKPCFDTREETLSPQPRGLITAQAEGKQRSSAPPPS
jgi:hypothetical protein